MNRSGEENTNLKFTLEVYEQITNEDQAYLKINKNILNLNKSLRKILTPEQYKIILEYEKEHAKLEFHSCSLVYSHFA